MAFPQTDLEVRGWLANLQLDAFTEAFLAAGFRGEKLLELSREELADLDVPKAQREYVILAVDALRRGDAPPTLATAQAPSYAPALTEQAIAACRQLGLQPPAPWVEAVAEQWPSPIAHEYQRLRQLLEQGQIVSAIFQLKDLAEVLVKFPALVMARDLIENGDVAAAKVARQSLFSGLLSMGHWVGRITGETLTPAIRALKDPQKLLMPELAEEFGATGKKGASAWLRALGDLVEWRNETLGHGAFRFDPQEYLPALTEVVKTINQHLAAQVERGLWAEVTLRGAEEPRLRGWQAIRHWHDGPAGAAHHEQEAPLWLEKGNRTLSLAPLVMLRHCTICTRQDVFLYDSLRGREYSDGFTLLDYLSGHRLSLPAHRAATLSGEAQAIDRQPGTIAAPPNDATPLEDDYGSTKINDLLEDKLLHARYLRPDYLREPLKVFVDSHERGVFWLTAPSHTGKSIFAHGLAFPADNKYLWPRDTTAVVVFHIWREFKVWPERLRQFIRDDVLTKAFHREAGRLPLPELEVKAANPAAALAALLHEAFRLKPSTIERLVLILDGLDELPISPDGEAGIADFIPLPDTLPEGCFLLLTSRPLPDCPPHIRHSLEHRFDGCTDFSAYALEFGQVGSAAYYQLLRAYFDRELEDRLKNDLYQAISAFVAGQAEVMCCNDLKQLQPATVAAFVQGEWVRLTQNVRVRSPQSAPSLVETVVQPVLARYDAAFAEVRRKATDRFLYVAHLSDLLRDGRLGLGEIAALPVGSGLYVYYLRQLQRVLVGADDSATAEGSLEPDNKLWAFFRRVILTLAAAEQAHVAFQQMLPDSVRDEVFRGVPLGILAALLDEPGRTPRLVFTLYSLKTILTVWKGEDTRDTRYALGLKDFTGAVAALWPEALQQTHRLLANQTLEALGGRWESVTDSDPLDRWRLQYFLGHIKEIQKKLSQRKENNLEEIDYQNLMRRVIENKINFLFAFKRFCEHSSDSKRNNKETIRWCSLAIAYYIDLDASKGKDKVFFWYVLAFFYKMRSGYNWILYNKKDSTFDIDKSILILENLYNFFGEKLGFRFKVGLSSALIDKAMKIKKLGTIDIDKIMLDLNRISVVLSPDKMEDDYGLSKFLFASDGILKILVHDSEFPSWPKPSSFSFIKILRIAVKRIKITFSIIFIKKPNFGLEMMDRIFVFLPLIKDLNNDWGNTIVYDYLKVIFEYITLTSSCKNVFITASDDAYLSSVLFRGSEEILPTLIQINQILKNFLYIPSRFKNPSKKNNSTKDFLFYLDIIVFEISNYAYSLYKNDLEKSSYYLNLIILNGEKAVRSDYSNFLPHYGGLNIVDIEEKLCVAYIERAMSWKHEKNNKMFLSDINRAIQLYELYIKEKNSLVPHEKLMVSGAYKERALFSLNHVDAIDSIKKSLEILVSLREELEKIGAWSMEEQEAVASVEKIYAGLLQNKKNPYASNNDMPLWKYINIKYILLLALYFTVRLFVIVILFIPNIILQINNFILFMRFLAKHKIKIFNFRKRTSVNQSATVSSLDNLNEPKTDFYNQIKYNREFILNNTLNRQKALEAINYFQDCIEFAKKTGDRAAELEAKRSLFSVKTEGYIILDNETIEFLLSNNNKVGD